MYSKSDPWIAIVITEQYSIHLDLDDAYGNSIFASSFID